MPKQDDALSIVAEAVRAACLHAALLAYEDAGIRGLCDEGRWEVAISAIRHLDLTTALGSPPDPGITDQTPAD
jgi:hypothetical protein